MRRMHHVIAGFAVLGLLTVASCAANPATSHPAAKAIQKLLELRAGDVRDAEAYAPYFEESALATALAEGSTEPTGTRQVPKWKRPYVSAETTETASVVVVWKPSADFPDWPLANVFSLARSEDRWVVVDAIETSAPPEPIKDLSAGRK